MIFRLLGTVMGRKFCEMTREEQMKFLLNYTNKSSYWIKSQEDEMCKYQICDMETKKPTRPMCKYTGDYCTYCVCGNGNTYNKAKQAEEK